VYQLAQVNIARILAPTDDPIMADFMNGLADINALAEQSAGFVWRLKTDAGDATELRPYDDPNLIVNLSVWQDIDSLHQYVYYSAHTDYYRRRSEWFHRLSTPVMALWWIPMGHIPTLDEAKERLAHLEQHGPTSHAFTFKQRFPAPAQQG
jgi:hypothetical protein